MTLIIVLKKHSYIIESYKIMFIICLKKDKQSYIIESYKIILIIVLKKNKQPYIIQSNFINCFQKDK